MKILLHDSPPRWLDLDAPTVATHAVSVNGCTLWRVICPFCHKHHYHGPGEGHRLAHCDPLTPAGIGYNLTLAQQPQRDLPTD